MKTMSSKKKLIYVAGPIHGSGTVEANVKMDNKAVKKLQRFFIKDLKRVL